MFRRLFPARDTLTALEHEFDLLDRQLADMRGERDRAIHQLGACLEAAAAWRAESGLHVALVSRWEEWAADRHLAKCAQYREVPEPCDCGLDDLLDANGARERWRQIEAVLQAAYELDLGLSPVAFGLPIPQNPVPFLNAVISSSRDYRAGSREQ